ncbi:MAG: DNA double-strand break repair nuclease NurA [Anaerolineales bacterium]
MSLDLPRVLPQVEKMGVTAARRARELGKRIPEARRALATTAALPAEELARRLDRAGRDWRGARPSVESLDSAIPAPDHPPQLEVIGADGSQIYPDRHAAALYFLVNIGSLHVVHGSGEAPQASSTPRLVFEDQDLYDKFDGLIRAESVQAERDIAEMEELARRAEAAPARASLALLDNGLLLWIALQEKELGHGPVEAYLSRYWAAMRRLRKAGSALAGFVDRPRSADVLSLLHLATTPLEAIDAEQLRATPFRGLADRALFAAHLKPGERSALFVDGSPVNLRFHEQGHPVLFFYLRIGQDDSIARVEVPGWVAERKEMLDTVHTGILEQSRITGIPYVLVRAHELAVVTQADRQRLDDLLGAELMRQGLAPRLSRKAETKRWTSSRRRHAL